MRLRDLETNLYLSENVLSLQDISNLFQSAEIVVKRDPIGSNRNLLGRAKDLVLRPDQKQQLFKTVLDRLRNSLNFSAAVPDIQQQFQSLKTEITKLSGPVTALDQKFNEYEKIINENPGIHRFMISLLSSIHGLLDKGIRDNDLIGFLKQVDQQFLKKQQTPKGAAPAAGTSPTPTVPDQPSVASGSSTRPVPPAAYNVRLPSSPVQEGIFDKVTRNDLVKAWKTQTNSTDDPTVIRDMLVKMIGDAPAKNAFAMANIPYPEGAPSATATRTASQSTGSASTGRTTSDRSSGSPAAGGGQPRRSSVGRSSQAAPAKITDYASAEKAVNDLLTQIKKTLTTADQTKLLQYIGEKIRNNLQP
jgi:uncharacterized protein YlxP (DUF503 family)